MVYTIQKKTFNLQGALQMKKLNAALLAIILTIILAPVAQASTLDEVKFYVKNYYYKEVPAHLETMQTIDEVTRSLDAYSYYMTKKEFDAYLKMISEHLPVEDNMTTTALLANAVTSKTLYGHTGYIKITNFSANIENTIALHWTRLKNQGAQRLIVDLRDNPGGFVESAEQLLSFFGGAKNAYYINTRHETKLVSTTPNTKRFPDETYLLLNRQSASASEIVAVSLKDQKAATIIGEKSFGKGTMQSFFQLGINGENGVLRLTTAEFKGPKGTAVNKIGITPDITAAPGKELAQAHRIALEKLLNKQAYTKLNPIQNVSSGTPIQINLPQPTNFQGTQLANRVELVQLGGGTMPITITQSKDYQSISIQPQTSLSPDAEYVVILHPETKRLNGKRTKSGLYTIVTPNSVKK